jgi:hypothetical protein
MSAEDRDAVVGRTLRLLKEAKEELGRLKAEANRRGERMEKLGHFLAAYPEHLIKEHESVDTRFANAPQKHLWLERDVVSPDDVVKLTADIRATSLKIAELTTELRNMGHGE